MFIINVHNSDCKICILGMEMTFMSSDIWDMHYFGLFLTGHWTSFVTQTWQPWCRADTFSLELYHMFPTELNYFSFYKHAKRHWDHRSGQIM